MPIDKVPGSNYPSKRNYRNGLRKAADNIYTTVKNTINLPGAKSITVTKGIFKRSKYNLITIDPKHNEALVYIASQKPNASFETKRIDFVAAKYPGIHVVINGTFFNNTPGGDFQPLGPVIYRQGKYQWTPTTVNYQGIPVYSFDRPFFAIDKNHLPVIRQSKGKRAEDLKKEGYLELLGGGGPLIQNGKIIVSKETLAKVGISPQTHQMNSTRQRTCIGINKEGKILICTFGHQGKPGSVRSGVTLQNLAQFMLDHGAKDAMFFDSGTSTGLYLSDEKTKSTGIPRRQPTYLFFVDKKTAKYIKELEERKEFNIKKLKLYKKKD
ncbi:MAG: phosphodiester glycosidase family protein [Armatimonadota bacterium]